MGQRGRQARRVNVPTLIGNIYAVATDRTNVHNKTHIYQSIYEMSITVSHTNIFQHFNIDIQQIFFGTNAGALFATEIIYEHVLQNALPLYLKVWHSKLVCLSLSTTSTLVQ